MQRWTGLLYAALFLGTVALVVVYAGRKPAAGPAGVDAGAAAASASAAAIADAGAADLDADVAPGEQPADLPGTVDAGGTLLPTGEPAPPLPPEAPKSVVFGVILVTYKGAQGAPAKSRSREEALELAKSIAADAKTDFKSAVARGDKSGSLENAGRMPRGMLEPAPEYVLFTLPKGAVADPVDTPRGFYVLQRIE